MRREYGVRKIWKGHKARGLSFVERVVIECWPATACVNRHGVPHEGAVGRAHEEYAVGVMTDPVHS